MQVLEVAEKWGIPPWEVAALRTDERRARWYWRQVAWDKAKDRREEYESKKVKHG